MMTTTDYTGRLAPYTPYFHYDAGELWIEGVPASELAKRFGTPLFAYSRQSLEERATAYLAAFEGIPARHHIALKANDSLTLLHLLRNLGFGADAASVGELHRADLAGFEGHDIVLNGNGKGAEDLIRAHRMGVDQITIDALFELPTLVETAAITGRTTVPVALRLNPDIDPATHPYLATGIQSSKFGIPPADLPAVLDFLRRHPQLVLTGIHCHIGSQIADVEPYQQALEWMIAEGEKLRADGWPLTDLSLGGGFAIPYLNGERFALTEYTDMLRTRLAGTDWQIRQEPGRFLFAEAAIMLMTVRGVKQTPAKTFLVVDAGMADNIRPALYHARHPVVPVRETTDSALVDLVGPLCESGDFLALDVDLPLLERDELLAQCCVGAYSYAMQMHYNGRMHPPEVLVSGADFALIRDREQPDDLGRRDLYFPEELDTDIPAVEEIGR